MDYQLAQINVAKMKGVNIDDPIMQEFVDNLDSVNALAESSDGFIWRLKDDDDNATGFNPYDDEQIIINISVWRDIPSLEHFTFKTMHTDFLKRRREWFHSYGKAYFAMWWIEAGAYPTIEEAVAKLDHLQLNGPSAEVFNFRTKFPKPRSVKKQV